jgi:hypothetical protein
VIQPIIQLLALDGALKWETVRPARVEILARFGAEDASALVSLHARETLPSVEVGDNLHIALNGIAKFRGKVSELRKDTAGSPLAIKAMRRPRRIYRGDVRGLYQNDTPTNILKQIVDGLPGPAPVYSGSPASTRVVDRLDFQGIPLFYAVDLLAKLAGNWLWWIDWDAHLKMVPPDGPPERYWYYDPESMALHPWLRDHSVKNLFRFLGGVVSGAEFERFFESSDSRARFGSVDETLYARAVSSETGYAYLRDAVLANAPWPGNYRAFDRFDGGLSASFGERIELRGIDLPPQISSGAVFRIAAEEILWSEEKFHIRYHLAEGYESATRYTRYIDHDPSEGSFVAAHVGVFLLDLSALDSEAHLDA